MTNNEFYGFSTRNMHKQNAAGLKMLAGAKVPNPSLSWNSDVSAQHKHKLY